MTNLNNIKNILTHEEYEYYLNLLINKNFKTAFYFIEQIIGNTIPTRAKLAVINNTLNEILSTSSNNIIKTKSRTHVRKN